MWRKPDECAMRTSPDKPKDNFRSGHRWSISRNTWRAAIHSHNKPAKNMECFLISKRNLKTISLVNHSILKFSPQLWCPHLFNWLSMLYGIRKTFFHDNNRLINYQVQQFFAHQTTLKTVKWIDQIDRYTSLRYTNHRDNLVLQLNHV